MVALFEGYGVPDMKVRVRMDANAAMGIVRSKGRIELRNTVVDVF